MIAAGLACWVGATAWFGVPAHVATLLGTIGPLVVAVVTWRMAEQTYRRNPPALTGLMMGAFVGKMVFYGAYVVVVIEGLSQPAVPFAASFTGSFVSLQLIEALALKRLFEG